MKDETQWPPVQSAEAAPISQNFPHDLADVVARSQSDVPQITRKLPKVYGASKVNEHMTWIRLRNLEHRIKWTARWPDFSFAKIPDSPFNAEIFWLYDFADIAAADYVLVLPPRDGVLRGALVEVGYGIALGKTIVLVGDCPDYGTWQHHHSVYKFELLEAALNFIKGAFR